VISTRVFSRQASLWANLTPTVEHVVRWLNANARRVTPAVSAIGSEPGNNALIAESAFALAAARSPLPDRLGEADIRIVREYLNEFSINPPSRTELESGELAEILQLAASLNAIISNLGTAVFWPKIPGCGVVDAAFADLMIEDGLYEVKTVSRNFRSPDVRQLLTYCAMLDASGTRPARIGLVNPRLGLRVTASLEFVCQGASGLSGAELLRAIAKKMSEMQVSV